MSELYIAKDNERLDSVVYKHYKSLENFEQVLELNPNLEPILKAGDRIILPKFKLKEKEQEALW
ncbi:phage tail protein [Campylobacter sp. MIT 99-7217]|uniref:tail protein X n=1 Tax=Campylobacter sp. MIT 99-7217 TaxID=535091 RepID=UPI00115B3D82|nr:tail protein X [Campylobacter sp. MIT 99-7217]TQR29333.1 phage tail protein [Campylobacter sp. MIT 99-7217]